MEMENSIWQASTNWNIAEGSLNRSISYDTSEDTENLPEAEPLLLTKPNVDDGSPPCEITIYFREKHEIHRVYVRSSARVYELYLSPNQQHNSEYLCTVRCGAVIEEVEEKSNETVSIPDQLVRNASNTSDEDGWVKVKVPNSQEHSTSVNCDDEISCLENQIHYEATAEMSDIDPCLSLTIRLLSVQIKDRVHINEIYIYTDPVDSHDTSPPASTVQNSETSTLFATLIPTLMKLSKSSTSQTTRFSKEASNEKNTTQEAFTSKAPVKTSCPDQEQPEVNHDVDQNNGQVYSRIEKVLNELVVKVDRVESFCSRFEEKLLKPLDSMEKKIIQLEQKLDSLVAENKSSNQCMCSSSTSECKARAGLVMKAPEFVDSENASTEDSYMEETIQNKKGASIDSALASSIAAFLSSANDSPTISHEPVNASNNSPLYEITSQNSAAEDSSIEFLTEAKNDDLFSAAKPSSTFTSEEGSDIIVMSPKTVNMFEFSNEGDDELGSKELGDIEIKNDATDHFDESVEFISSSLDLNENLIPTDVNVEQDTDVLYEVKFSRDENWVSGLPLEFLLTDISDPSLLEASTIGGHGDCIGVALDSDTDSDVYGSWVS